MLSSRAASDSMANAPHARVPSFVESMGGADGAVTFDEAVEQVHGNKLSDVMKRPISTYRVAGSTTIGDWPIRTFDSNGFKLEQFIDVVLNHEGVIDKKFFEDTLVKLCAQGRYSDLPAPFSPKKEPTVPYTMQIVIGYWICMYDLKIP